MGAAPGLRRRRGLAVSHPGRGQSLARPVPPRHPDRCDLGSAARFRPAGGAPQAGDHRIRADGGERREHRHAASAAWPRHLDRARRFRNRILLAQLSAHVSVRPDQDRPFFRERIVEQHRLRRDRFRGRRARAQPSRRYRGGGRRDRGAAPARARGRLHPRAGLSVRPALPGGGARLHARRPAGPDRGCGLEHSPATRPRTQADCRRDRAIYNAVAPANGRQTPGDANDGAGFPDAAGAMTPVAPLPASIAVACLVLGAAAQAQDWPARPVRIVSPFAAGGSSDTMGRLIAERLSEQLHQPFYVENRGGAGGLIGSAAVAGAAPDGYTFLISSIGTHVIAPSTSANAGYDPLGDFTHVAFKGSGQAIGDLVAGHVKMGSITWTAAIGQMRGRTMVPLAVSAARRMAEFPDVPTLSELGYPELAVTTWFGFAGPAGLARITTERMNREIGAALDAKAVRDRLDADGFERASMSPAELTAFVRRELAKWSPLAKKLTAAEAGK